MPVTRASRAGSSLGPGVQPGDDPGRDRVGAARLDQHPAQRGPLSGAGGQFAGGQDGGCVGEHRVVAVGHRGGAGMVALTTELEPVAAVRPDRGRDPDRLLVRGQPAALLDVQFDVLAHRAQPVGRPGGPRVASLRSHHLTQAGALVISQGQGLLRGDRAGGQPGTEAGHAEASALLVGEVHHAQRTARRPPGRLQPGHRCQRGADPRAARPAARLRAPNPGASRPAVRSNPAPTRRSGCRCRPRSSSSPSAATCPANHSRRVIVASSQASRV